MKGAKVDTLDILLLSQIWGGIFYLFNKIFFSLSERNEGKKAKQWRIWAWIVYLIGLPAVVAMLALKHNWIFAALEIGGAPAMVLGLVIAFRNEKRDWKWLNHFAIVTIVAGVSYSVYDFGGITTLTQWLEIAAVVGFLAGTYRLAQKQADGYLWYILMTVATGWLFWIEDLTWFTLQQVISLGFIVDAYMVWKRKQSAK